MREREKERHEKNGTSFHKEENVSISVRALSLKSKVKENCSAYVSVYGIDAVCLRRKFLE